MSKKLKNKFGEMIEDYLKERENLKMVFMIIDIRHKPTEDDILMYNYLKYYNIPVTIIATKVDKISKNNYDKSKKIIKESLKIDNDTNIILFSSHTKQGKDEVHNLIENILK